MKSVKFEYYEYSKKSKSKIWLHKAFKESEKILKTTKTIATSKRRKLGMISKKKIVYGCPQYDIKQNSVFFSGLRLRDLMTHQVS